MKKRRRRRRMDPNTFLVIRQVLIGLMIVSFIGLLISAIWYGSRVQALTITNVEVSGGETISHELVREKVWSELQGEYLRLVPRVFAWTYPEEAIYNSVNTVSRIKDVHVRRTDGNTLRVTFDEYVPDSLWCNLDEHPYCYFLDEEGFAFSEAPNLSGGAFVRFTRIGSEPQLGEFFADADTYESVQKLLILLNDAGWFASQVDVDLAGDAFVQIVGGGQLKVSTKQNPTDTVNNLATVLNSDEFTDIVPGNFNYIDLRFGNKVFVNEVFETATSSATSSLD